MNLSEAITVRRPQRWDKPMDASMNDADVAWLRSRDPFASMDPKSFPRTTPLEGILRNDCRLIRCEAGEVLVREGDYGNSAFLVLAGSVSVMVDSLSPEQLGRTPKEKLSWPEALRRFLFRSPVPEAREPSQVVPLRTNSSGTIRTLDDRQAIFLQDFDLVMRDYEHVSLGPGELFGEVAAMYRSPRTATVIAENEATLLEIRWQGLRMFRRDQVFADTLDAHYREQWLPVHLREIPLLRYLPEANLQRVVDATGLHSYGRMEWDNDYKRQRKLPLAEQIGAEPVVAEEGRLPTDLIVVRSGFGRLSQHYGASHRTTAYLGKGHLFGFEELAYNSLRDENLPPKTLQHSLRAVGFLDTLSIPAEVFAEAVLPHVRRSELPDDIAKLVTRRDQTITAAENAERRTQARLPQSKRDGGSDLPIVTGTGFQQTELLEFVVQNRLNNGQQAMVIDLNRCTRCDDCVKACASVNDGNPRFARQGLIHDRLQFVQACMHCEDPVCMIGCPTGSIARDVDTGVVMIHEPICIGCGTCANACPYQNIHMASIRDRSGKPYCDSASGKPITKATKCDLCSTQPNGPACASACPHDALVRINLTESAPLSQWLDRRS
tara:strand:+ start:25754 stop:27574 length:1821 start_codon:yes stop_codon:yes gene_type:complete